MQLREGILFDRRYLLKRVLGSGGYSQVWLAEDTLVDHDRVAIKIYAPDRGLDNNGVLIFKKEFKLVGKLNHPNLLRSSHFNVSDCSPYLIMDFCDHGSAFKLIGNISEEQAWNFLHDVATGLAYLHEQEPPIIHQDIKPDNVLIDNHGHFLISDFGISTKVRSTLRKSVEKAKAGTFAYMAPERFGKDNTHIKASDIWSLGATLFELITGEVPFGDHGGLIQKSGAEIPNITGNYSGRLVNLVYACLNEEPWNRPTAIQIAGDLNDQNKKQLTHNELKSLQTDIETLCENKLFVPALKKCKEILTNYPDNTFAKEKRMHLELIVEEMKKKQRKKDTTLIVIGIIISIIVAFILAIISESI